jgi:hypothetical protein
VLETLKIARHVAVEERDADTRVDRKPTVLPGEHVGGGVRIEKPLPLEESDHAAADPFGERGQVCGGERSGGEERRRPGLIDWKGGMNSSGDRSTTISGVTVRISGTTDPVLLDATTTGKGSQNVILNGGAVLEAVNGDIIRNVGTGSGAIQWTGDGGFSAFGGNRAVSLASGGSLTWGATSFVPDGNALLLSTQHADSRIDFQNPLALGGLQRVVQVATGSAAVDARLSGILSGGLTGGLGKEGLGTLSIGRDLTWNASNAWLFELGLAADSLAAAASSTNNNDLLSLGGALTRGSGSSFTFDFGDTGSDGWYRLVDYVSTTFATGPNSSFAATGLPSGKSANFVVDADTTALYVQIVPEPAVLGLAAGGVALLGLAVWRRRRTSAGSRSSTGRYR